MSVDAPAHGERRGVEQRPLCTKPEGGKKSVSGLLMERLQKTNCDQGTVNDEAGIPLDAFRIAAVIVDAVAVEGRG